MAWKPYLQLIRLPNVFTAAADSLAGWLVVGGSLADPGGWLPLVGTSMAVYAGGIALNDYYDLEVDRAERPGRPLPSGRVSWRFAAVLGWGLLALGLSLATLGGLAAAGTWASGVVALALIGSVVAYDTFAKKTPAGPVVMGACRGGNFLLGMSQAPDLGGPSGWWIAGAITLYVAGITCLSRSEVHSGRRAGLILGAALQGLAVAGLVVVLAKAGQGMGPDGLGLLAFGPIAVLAGLLARRDLAAIREAAPGPTQRAVVFGVLSLVWWDVAVVLVLRGVLPVLAVASLWVPAFLLSKRLQAT